MEAPNPLRCNMLGICRAAAISEKEDLMSIFERGTNLAGHMGDPLLIFLEKDLFKFQTFSYSLTDGVNHVSTIRQPAKISQVLLSQDRGN